MTAHTNELPAFEAWWKSEGQFCRAGGGDYEKTFAFRSWQAARRGPVVPHAKVDVVFRWDSENQHHIPMLLIEFEPVPAGEPCDAKGWSDRDNLAAMLDAAPQPQKTLKSENVTLKPETASVHLPD